MCGWVAERQSREREEARGLVGLAGPAAKRPHGRRQSKLYRFFGTALPEKVRVCEFGALCVLLLTD